jgi:aspartate 1-decarboxylase
MEGAHVSGAGNLKDIRVLAILRFSPNVLKDMQLTLLKSKLHRATVTGASLHYEGSMTISRDLAERVGLLPYEKILVGNMGNGERFETYVIYGEAGTGQIQLNGATAHLGKIGDRVTIMNFGSFTPEEAVGHKPRVLVLNEKNEAIRYDCGSQQEEFQVVV